MDFYGIYWVYGILWIPIGEFGRNLCYFRVSGHPVDSTGFLWILEPGGAQ